MILKRIYEQYGLNIENILIDNMKRLNLTKDELIILLVLFNINKKRRTFSIVSISRLVEYNQNEIATIIESLLEKEFITIKLEETSNNKEREVFDLDKTFIKITNLFKEDEKERRQNIFENNISKTILAFEKSLGRMLRPNELIKIRKWYDEEIYEHDKIIAAIKEAKERASIPFVERILTQQIPKEVEIDEKTEEILDQIYKKL